MTKAILSHDASGLFLFFKFFGLWYLNETVSFPKNTYTKITQTTFLAYFITVAEHNYNHLQILEIFWTNRLREYGLINLSI